MSHTRDDAWALLAELTKSQALRRHALAVEATMRHLARTSGRTDEDEITLWGLAGMLHDFDYERFPQEPEHPLEGMKILRERGWPESLVLAIGGHAFGTGIPRESHMARALLAADELTGFVGACALVRPSKKIADVPVESVLKRLKEKAFAKGVDRAYVTKGVEEWGTPLPDLVKLVLEAQVPIADRLGLGGSPAADLPDAPAPPMPAPPLPPSP